MSEPADVFAEVFRLLTPERLLHDPRATGEGISVCVIDSGVERAALEAKFNRDGHTIHPIEGAVFSAASTRPLPYEGQQSTPHGTTVADIILTLRRAFAFIPPTFLAHRAAAKWTW